MQSTKKRQRKYDPGMWESAAVHVVAQFPEGIDGLVVYNITNISDGQSKMATLATDGRKCKKSSVTEWKNYGPMRYSNEAYKVVAGDDTLHFNPKGWCTDMAGANMNGLLRVFGDDVLTHIKTCEFHFKESKNKIARTLWWRRRGFQGAVWPNASF